MTLISASKFSLKPYKLLCILSVIPALLLSGCGAGTVDTSVSTVQGPASAVLQGTVYGGHAPIVGAEVFILTPGITGYYSKATDISTNSALPTDSTFGYHYVTTTAGGFFNITGDYACTPNYPVFLAAYGGNPNTSPQLTVTGVTISGTGPYTIKVTYSDSGLVYAGEVVTFYNLTGAWAFLNGNQTVLADSNLTTSTFDISIASNGGNATGSYTTSGYVQQATTGATNNPGIVNLAVLGLCPSSGSTNFAGVIPGIYMNEVSTVAAAYALGGFQSGPWYDVGIPAPGTDALALQGIQNAALTAANLYDITGGNLGTTPAGPDYHIARATTSGGNGTVPQYLLDTLGNILASCVDSNNTSGTASPACSSLFGYAKSSGTSGSTPTEIATAAFNIAHNPWANVTNLFNIPIGQVPFVPSLASAPNDFSVGISYSGGGLNNPFYSAVDGSGNIWIGNQGSQLGTTISEFSPLGVALSGTGFSGGGLLDSYGIAVDTSGNVWTANYSANTISKFNSSGTAISPATGYTGANLYGPYEVAFDKSGNLWTPNWGNASYNAPATISEFTSTGTAVGSYSGSGLGRGRDIAISASTIYIVNETNSTLSEFNVSTGAALNSGVTGGGLYNSTGVALDSTGNIWTVNGNNSISEFTTAGTALSPSTGYTGGGLNNTHYIAIDGANNIFTSNSSGNSISELSNSGTAITNSSGYVATTNSGSSPLNNAQDIVIDGSGNAWVVNFGNNRLVEYVGIAAPVVTPVVQALINGKYGQKP